MILTIAEVKNNLRLTETYTSQEHIVASTTWKRLANKPVNSIVNISADTNENTGTTRYTTSDYQTDTDFAGYRRIRIISTGNITTGDTYFASYSNGGYDAEIKRLIPIVQDDIVEYLNNHFPDKNTMYITGNMDFATSTGSGVGPKLTDTYGYFLKYGFAQGYDIALEGSYRNRGIYTIANASSVVLTLTTDRTIQPSKSTDYYGNSAVRITRIVWPEGLKYLVSQIIWLNIDKSKGDNIQSMSLGPSSITYRPLGSGSYPEQIYQALSKYRNANIK